MPAQKKKLPVPQTVEDNTPSAYWAILKALELRFDEKILDAFPLPSFDPNDQFIYLIGLKDGIFTMIAEKPLTVHEDKSLTTFMKMLCGLAY